MSTETSAVPADLVALRLAFLEADRQCRLLADLLPPASAVLAGAEVPERDAAALAETRARRLAHVMDLFHHPWWSTVPNRFEAEQQLRAAADAAAEANAVLK